jgi:hypothetical protein
MMLSSFSLVLIAVFATAVVALSNQSNVAYNSNIGSEFEAYLISTFSDVNPTVQFYLSKGNNPSNFAFANKARPVLTSTVGTKAVRDVFLACNRDRTQWYMMGTGKYIKPLIL